MQCCLFCGFQEIQAVFFYYVYSAVGNNLWFDLVCSWTVTFDSALADTITISIVEQLMLHCQPYY